ncbi:MAG: hypothetical protein RML99_06590, partial [Anaerolineae bacterium]|nr:hypothetical protein [Anaerolineae bacterium]
MLPENFSNYIPGAGDSVQNYWNLWWLTRSFRSGDFLPYYSEMIYWPEGVTLAQHPLNLFNGWLAFALQSFGLSLVETYNVITLLAFTLSGLSAFALCYYLTRRALPAFIGGAIFAFSPFAVHRAMVGNLSLHTLQFLPLTALFLLLLLRTRRWVYAIGAALSFGISFYMNLYVLLAMGLLLVMLTIAEAARQRSAQVLGLAAAVCITGALIGSPFLVRYAADSVQFRDQANQIKAARENNADLLAFVTPDPWISFVYRQLPEVTRLAGEIRSMFFGNPAEKTVFIGLGNLIVLAVTAPFWLRSGRRWWLAATAFFVLALGPTLYVLGRPLLDGMPYEWLNRLPMVGFGRTPSRMAMAIMLCIGVLVAIGLANVKHRAAYAALLAMSLVALAEVIPLPMHIDKRVAQVPLFYAAHFARLESQGAILDVPVDLWAADGPGGEYMLYQTVHGQPIVGGYIARTPRHALWPFNDLPFVRALRARIRKDREPYAFSPEVLERARADLARLKIRYVVLHRSFLPAGDHQVVQAALQAALGRPIHQDEWISVWDTEAQA